MKKIIYFLFCIGCWTACSQNEQNDNTTETPASTINKTELAQEIKVLEDKLLAIQDARKDTAAAAAMIEKTELYVHTFPQDSLSPFILFRAGDVARGAEKFEKAVALWDKNWRTYEDHRPSSWFFICYGIYL